jgi:hypothetical protein
VCINRSYVPLSARPHEQRELPPPIPPPLLPRSSPPAELLNRRTNVDPPSRSIAERIDRCSLCADDTSRDLLHYRLMSVKGRSRGRSDEIIPPARRELLIRRSITEARRGWMRHRTRRENGRRVLRVYLPLFPFSSPPPPLLPVASTLAVN